MNRCHSDVILAPLYCTEEHFISKALLAANWWYSTSPPSKSSPFQSS